jgi:hypothetical protein
MILFRLAETMTKAVEQLPVHAGEARSHRLAIILPDLVLNRVIL